MECNISTEYITLGQFLKYFKIISNGSYAKKYLNNTKVFVNTVLENKRGKKLRNGDIVQINNVEYKIVNNERK